MNNKLGFLSIIILGVILMQLLLTLTIGMGPNTNPVEIYVRNFSSMAALLILAIFFEMYDILHKPLATKIHLKRMKKTSLILAVASLVKAVISAIYSITYISSANIVFFYYLGETVVWTAVFCFAIAYHKHLKRNY